MVKNNWRILSIEYQILMMLKISGIVSCRRIRLWIISLEISSCLLVLTLCPIWEMQTQQFSPWKCWWNWWNDTYQSWITFCLRLLAHGQAWCLPFWPLVWHVDFTVCGWTLNTASWSKLFPCLTVQIRTQIRLKKRNIITKQESLQSTVYKMEEIFVLQALFSCERYISR